MPRCPRIHLANLPLHIVQRGHNRDACFFAEEDCHSYRHWLEEVLKSTGCLLHAYVQMTNHVHLLLTQPDNRLEALTGDRAGQHSIRINDQWLCVLCVA